MKIVIAPNAFKNALSAEEVTNAIRSGLATSGLDAEFVKFPIGDGGDGSGSLLAKHLHANWVDVEVNNPLGKVIRSGFSYAENDKIAIIEMADASGLRLLNRRELNPLHASSFGTGQLIEAALFKDVKKMILCVGGSATIDGGAGALQALGVKWIDKKGNEVRDIPFGLIEVVSLDTEELNKKIHNAEIALLCDVGNPLIGERGAAKIFGPQKGASKEQVDQLEVGLHQLADVVSDNRKMSIHHIKHGGAAGGIAAVFCGLLGATLYNGIDYFLDITGFETVLRDADLVITGEGIIDQQTLEGKGPYGVAVRAKNNKVRVIALAGQISSHEKLRPFFDELICINPEISADESAIPMTRDRLIECSRALGRKIAGN
jgi:glycerate 2-kinase